MKKLLASTTVAIFLFSMSFGASAGTTVSTDTKTSTSTSTSTGQSQGLNVQDSFKFLVTNVTKDNVSVGGWLHASGMASQLPDIPLHYKLSVEQYNEATPGEIFTAMPEVITREMIQTYEEVAREELGFWDNWKVDRNTNGRSFTWVKYEPTDELRVFPRYPDEEVAKKGVAYNTICRLVFNSEDEIVYREDLAFKMSKWAMNKGGNAIIVTGAGARRVFAAKSGALSVLGAFGQVFTNAWTGAMNVSPGAGLASGSNQTETLPYLRVTVIRINNLQKVLEGVKPLPKKKKSAPTNTIEVGALDKIILIKKK